MSLVVFSNPGELDPFVIQTMGVSAKTGTNPIGYFGTGLKFAIAVLLRNQQNITIFSGRRVFTFDILTKEFRDKTFQQIILYETFEGVSTTHVLGFTTDLGKNWELWMAHRELYCNALDEGGTCSVVEKVEPEEGKTHIAVTGYSFLQTHHNRNYMLTTAPLYSDGSVAFHPGASDRLYYRGLVVGKLSKPSVFTLNILHPLTLTEDRTFKHSHEIVWAVRGSIERCTNSTILSKILCASELSFEGDFNWETFSIEEGSMLEKVLETLYESNHAFLSTNARKRWRQHRKVSDYTPIPLSPVGEKMLEKAIAFLEKIGYDVKAVNVVGNLPPNVHGRVEHGKIYISPHCFDRGTKYLAATILEEHLHLETGLSDYTREFQNLLFDKIISLGERMLGEPI